MKLRSKVLWMSCLAYLEQGAPWHSSNFEVKFQSIQICDLTKTQVTRNGKGFFDDYKPYLETLNENYHICNETINKNAKSQRRKAVRNQILTNTVTMTTIEDDHFPEFFNDLMLIYRKNIIVLCCSGTWVIYNYVDNGLCFGKICPSVIKINKIWIKSGGYISHSRVINEVRYVKTLMF